MKTNIKTIGKLIITIIIGVVLFSSCANEDYNQEPTELKISGKYTYNGHTYLQFQNFYGLTHDPDCPCHNHE